MRRTDRRRRLTVLALASQLLACERAVPATELAYRLADLHQPNIVLIVVDTLRADWTSPYGYALDTSPELARWAERGILFENVRSQSSWTKVSMSSMLSSLWPRSHGIRRPDDGLGDGALMLAEVLHDGGYQTYAVQSNGWLDQSFGFHQGFDRYVFPRGMGSVRLSRSMIWPHAGRVLEEGLRIVEKREAGPFFLYMHFMDVHEYASPLGSKLFGEGHEGTYLAAIRWVDQTVRDFREALEREGLLEHTVIVFASDHGEAFGEHGRYGHARDALTATLHVPLVIRFPFAVEPVRVATQVSNVDIAPTLVELAGLEIPEVFEGRSLLPLAGAPQSAGPDLPSYAGMPYPLFRDTTLQESVSDGDWAYARDVAPDRPVKEHLFDRRVDPGENVDLIDREPDQAARLRGLLDAYREREPGSRVRETGVRIDPHIAVRLRQMGYLESGEPQPEAEGSD